MTGTINQDAVLLRFTREPELLHAVLVIAGVHDGLQIHKPESVIANCSLLVASARANEVPLAYVRFTNAPVSGALPRYPAWISGFGPTRNDMIFDSAGLSLYENLEFAGMIGDRGGRFYLAGCITEKALLSTAAEADRRGQRVTFISDACACPMPLHQPDGPAGISTQGWLLRAAAAPLRDRFAGH